MDRYTLVFRCPCGATEDCDVTLTGKEPNGEQGRRVYHDEPKLCFPCRIATEDIVAEENAMARFRDIVKRKD
jgi:hypothetical protein